MANPANPAATLVDAFSKALVDSARMALVGIEGAADIADQSLDLAARRVLETPLPGGTIADVPKSILISLIGFIDLAPEALGIAADRIDAMFDGTGASASASTSIAELVQRTNPAPAEPTGEEVNPEAGTKSPA